MDMQTFLERRISAAGSLRELARQTGIDVGYLSKVAAGKRNPGPDFLNALGLEKIVSYRKKNYNGTR